MPGRAALSPAVILQNAYTLCHQGKVREAEELFHSLRNIPSLEPVFINQLGVLAHLLGKSQIGLDYLHKSVELQPSAPFYNNLGLVQEQTGNLHSAQHSYEQAIQRDPRFAQAHYNLGNTLQKKSQYREAVESYRQAIQLKRDYAQAYNNLGFVLQKIGLLHEAEIALRTSLQITPSSLGTLLNLTSVLYYLGNYHEALELVDQVLAVDPQNEEAYKYLCLAQNSLGETEKAIACSQEAMAHAENNEIFLTILGTIYGSRGDKQKAAGYLRQALDLSPDNGIIHFKLAQLHTYSKSDEHLTEMEAIYTSAARPLHKHYLCLALGKAYEDRGEYRHAFQFIAEGNRLLRASSSFNIESEAAFFHTIRTIFQPEFLHRVKGYGNTNAGPIFIVGMPRSGTTLVEQILASHPEVHGGGELTTLDLITRKTLWQENKFSYPDDIQTLSLENFTKMGQEYIDMVKKNSPDTQRITDKMPHNFFFVGLIHAILPKATIIHCKRDAMDTCWSNYKNFFDPPHLYAQDLTELGKYYILYRELMQYWREVLPGRMYEIEYEKIIESQEEETRKLLHHCGLSWDDSCLNFHQSERQVHTSSMSQVKKPLYSSSVNKWKCFEQELKPLHEIINS